MELRNAIINSSKERLSKASDEQIKQALLDKYDNMIRNIPYLLDHSFNVKRLTAMSMGMEGQADYNSEMEFYTQRQRMILDSSKLAATRLVGIPLTMDQDKRLDSIKEETFGMKVSDYDEEKEEYEVVESVQQENNLGIIDRLKTIKEKIEKKDLSKQTRLDARMEKSGDSIPLSQLYKDLSVRPMKFISAMVDGKEISKLVLVREKKEKLEEEGKKL